jgi:mono/diheme cytochrome c family protein
VGEQEGGLSAFWATIAISAVLLAGGLAVLSGYFIGHFSNPREKTVTIVQAGLPGMKLAGTSGGGAGTATPTTPTSTTTSPTTTSTTPSPTTSSSATTATAPVAPATGAPVKADGRQIFAANCASCHTLAAAGASGTAGPNLDSLKPDAKTVAVQVTNGGGGMPAFGKTNILSKAQIQAVSTFVNQVAGKQP